MIQRYGPDQPAGKIPDFTSRAEEAAWWDSHSITDYLDELEPVEVRFAKNLSRSYPDQQSHER